MAKRELIEPKPGGESYIRRCVLFPPVNRGPPCAMLANRSVRDRWWLFASPAGEFVRTHNEWPSHWKCFARKSRAV